MGNTTEGGEEVRQVKTRRVRRQDRQARRILQGRDQHQQALSSEA